MPTTTATGAEAAAGIEALRKLKSTDPPLYLSPSIELSKAARVASEHLFSSLKPYTPKSPFNHLLVNGFDAEQIWQQIDLQSQSLISTMDRQVRKFERNREEIQKLFDSVESKGNHGNDEKKREVLDLQKKSDGLAREDEVFEDDEMRGFEEDDEDDEDEDEEEDEDGDENDEEEEEGKGLGVEDKFLKIKELEEFLEEDEAREYGLKGKKKGESGNEGKIMDEDHDEEEEEEGDDEEDDEDVS